MRIIAIRSGTLWLTTGDALVVHIGDEFELSTSGTQLVDSGLFEFIGGPDQAGSPPLPAGQTELEIVYPEEYALNRHGKRLVKKNEVQKWD